MEFLCVLGALCGMFFLRAFVSLRETYIFSGDHLSRGALRNSTYTAPVPPWCCRAELKASTS